MVSIRNEIVINKPILEVSNYAADPNNSTKWCKKVISIQWKTANDIIQAIEKESESSGKIDFEKSNKVKDYLQTNDNFLDIRNYV